jgi:hypothetical protein
MSLKERGQSERYGLVCNYDYRNYLGISLEKQMKSTIFAIIFIICVWGIARISGGLSLFEYILFLITLFLIIRGNDKN